MKLFEWLLEFLTGVNPHKTKEERIKVIKEIHKGVQDGSLDAATVQLGMSQLEINVKNRGTRTLKGDANG
jgi:hypothetical protein